MFGVKTFHSYLFGHHIVLQTDQKPLMTLFNKAKAVRSQASGRIQHWALPLALYEYIHHCLQLLGDQTAHQCQSHDPPIYHCQMFQPRHHSQENWQGPISRWVRGHPNQRNPNCPVDHTCPSAVLNSAMHLGWVSRD